jgi:hypothetical protein
MSAGESPPEEQYTALFAAGKEGHGRRRLPPEIAPLRGPDQPPFWGP